MILVGGPPGLYQMGGRVVLWYPDVKYKIMSSASVIVLVSCDPIGVCSGPGQYHTSDGPKYAGS